MDGGPVQGTWCGRQRAEGAAGSPVPHAAHEGCSLGSARPSLSPRKGAGVLHHHYTKVPRPAATMLTHIPRPVQYITFRLGGVHDMSLLMGQLANLAPRTRP